MTTPSQVRFAEEHDVVIANVERLSWLAERRARYATHECNGDYYPGQNAEDKDACSQAWGKDVELVDKEILALAKLMRFDNVDFGSGLYPNLVVGGRTFYIPL